MSVHIVTGKLGAGKTLVAIGRIQDYLARGRIVATNLDLKIHNMPKVGRLAKKTRVIRVPDKPSLFDFESIGRGNLSYDESQNGLLVLDECGTWFNSRNWSDKTRQPVIDWCLHARKLGWDIIFIIQDISLMDKQAREALAEHVVYCRRTDKLSIPFIGGILSIFANYRITLPKIHFGIVKYGDLPTSLTVDKWTYTGKDLYSSYDTKQVFTSSYDSGSYSLIPPYYLYSSSFSPRGFIFFMRNTKIYFKRLNRVFLAFSFLALGLALGFYYKTTQVSNHSQPQNAIIKSNINKIDHSPANLPKLSITTFSQLGYDVLVTFKGSDSKIYNASDLSSLGYRIDVKDSCSVLISKADYTQKVNCED